MTALANFRLEEYLAPREFASNILFCASDVEAMNLSELLSFISDEEKEKFLRLSLMYTSPSGSPELRQSLAEMHALQPDQFLCFAGAEEAIYCAARSLLSSQDHAIVITPCYQSLKSVAAAICPVSEIPLEKENSRWNLNLDRIRAAIRPNTQILFINFPHNPTGYTPSLQVFKDLIELVRKHNLILFSDEVYRGLCIEDEDRLPNASLLYERAISLDVTSKSFGLPGLRIGWISTQDFPILKKLESYKHYLSICNSAPSEFLAKIAIDQREVIWKEKNQVIRKNYSILKGYFTSHSHLFQWIEPQGGCVCYPRYLGSKKITTVADELLKQHQVVILPDWVYEEETNHFRVSFGRKNMPLALERFDAFFQVNEA